MSTVHARFYVHQITKNATNYTSVTLLPAVRGKDNADWSKYTPSGKIDMNVSGETAAAAWFESMLGKDVSITFEERDPAETESESESGAGSA